ncbi:hypothetical protein [Pseudomonas sp. Z3-8]|uniref:hypothetical protein n=1 Tax=Pseudomonas sp. Z3-8 TaxID=2817412 RepID=UPI003DA99931
MKTHAFPSKPAFEGFQQSSITSVSQEQLVAPVLYRNGFPFIPHETQGIIIPVELASSHIHVYVHIPTADLPEAATVSIKVRALDGSVGFASESLPINPPETIIIEVPQNQLKLFAGKELALRYFIELPDGEPVGSEELFARVTSPIAYTPPVVEGLNNSTIKASDYPNGLNVDEAVIENLEYPSVVLCLWVVSIRLESGEVITLYSQLQSVPASPDSPYQFRIPVQAYTGYPAEAIGRCTVAVDFAPHDPEAQTYGVGGHEFSFIN